MLKSNYEVIVRSAANCNLKDKIGAAACQPLVVTCQSDIAQ